jgi:hypothetical protein
MFQHLGNGLLSATERPKCITVRRIIADSDSGCLKFAVSIMQAINYVCQKFFIHTDGAYFVPVLGSGVTIDPCDTSLCGTMTSHCGTWVAPNSDTVV